MRSVQVSVRVPRKIGDIWQSLGRMETWAQMSAAFAGWGSYRYALENGSSLGPNAEFSALSSSGKSLLRWRVSSWSPPNELELTLVGAKRSERFHLLLVLKLSELDDDLTEIQATLVLIFSSRFLELLSLALPVGLLYAGRLERALKKLRGSPC